MPLLRPSWIRGEGFGRIEMKTLCISLNGSIFKTSSMLTSISTTAWIYLNRQTLNRGIGEGELWKKEYPLCWGLQLVGMEKRFGDNLWEQDERSRRLAFLGRISADRTPPLKSRTRTFSHLRVDEVGERHGKANRSFVEPRTSLSPHLVAKDVKEESNIENALEDLKEVQSKYAMIRRDSHFVSNLPARELVPIDIVELRGGEKVPADVHILSLISSMRSHRILREMLQPSPLPRVTRDNSQIEEGPKFSSTNNGQLVAKDATSGTTMEKPSKDAKDYGVVNVEANAYVKSPVTLEVTSSILHLEMSGMHTLEKTKSESELNEWRYLVTMESPGIEFEKT
eukprot:Gb_07700 [translate_table: standard]